MFSTNYIVALFATLCLIIPQQLIGQQNLDFISQNGLATEVSETVFDPLGNNLIAFESHKGFVYDVKTGLERGHFECDEEITSLLIVDNFTFYIGFATGKIEQRNLNNCDIKASYETKKGPVYAITSSNTNKDELLLGGYNLLLLNTSSGKVTDLPYSLISQIKNNKDKSGYQLISTNGASIVCIQITNNYEVKNKFYVYEQPKLKFFLTQNKMAITVINSMNFDFYNDHIVLQTFNDKIKFYDLDKNEILFKESTYYLQEFFTSIAVSDTFKIALATTNEGSLYIYDLRKNKFIKNFKTPHLSKINDISVSSNGLFFVTSSDDYTVILWDTKTLEPIRTIYSKSFPLTGVECGKFSGRIITSNSAGIISVFDLSNPNIFLGSKELSRRSITDFEMLNQDSLLLFSSESIISKNHSYESNISMYNLYTNKIEVINKTSTNKGIDYSINSGFLNLGKNISNLNGKKLIKLKKGDKARCIYSLMSPDQTKIITLNMLPLYVLPGVNATKSKNSDLLSSLNYYELVTDKKNPHYRQKYVITSGRIPFNSMEWISDSKFLYINYQTLMLFDFTTQTADTLISNADFFKVEKTTNELYVAQNGDLCVYKNFDSTQLTKCLKVGSGISDMDWYDDNKKLAISFDDGSLKLWSLETDSMICHFIAIDKSSLIILDPEGYFMSINNGLNGVGYRVGEQIFPPEQFDLKYNRPDIILTHLGYADSSLIEAYHEAYLKRLKKMGFTEDMLKDDLHLPEINIENYASIPIISDKDTLELNLKLQDSKYPLDRINVWVNDVAIFGTNGINLREKNILTYETKLSVPLAFGKNKIQVSTMNQAGVESYKETVEIESTKGKTKPDLYVVSIGVSNYKDSRYNLSYASKDANDIATVFQTADFFDNVFSKTITDADVTLENLPPLRTFLMQADINDQIILFVAGHGVLDKNFDYYFASYDMDFQNPSARGIPYEMIEALIDGIKPLKKLLFMDTCHSGEVDKDEIQVSDNKTESENDITFRNVGVEVENKENQLGLQNTSELMKSLFTDLRKGTGATVISSAGGVEFAMESDTWQNGLFTYCLINGLTTKAADLNKDKMITVSELQIYVQAEVSKLSNGKQTPTSRIQNNEMDYRVW